MVYHRVPFSSTHLDRWSDTPKIAPVPLHLYRGKSRGDWPAWMANAVMCRHGDAAAAEKSDSHKNFEAAPDAVANASAAGLPETPGVRMASRAWGRVDGRAAHVARVDARPPAHCKQTAVKRGLGQRCFARFIRNRIDFVPRSRRERSTRRA